MAKKSKAQRARASARRQEKKERARIAAEEELNQEPEPEVEKGAVTKFLESTPLKKSGFTMKFTAISSLPAG